MTQRLESDCNSLRSLCVLRASAVNVALITLKYEETLVMALGLSRTNGVLYIVIRALLGELAERLLHWS
jgi:hypothetical protein